MKEMRMKDDFRLYRLGRLHAGRRDFIRLLSVYNNNNNDV